jgi:hypothetical protein
MDISLAYCRVMLIIALPLVFVINDFQDSNASTIDGDNENLSNELPFSLPFNSNVTNQTGNAIPFP